FFQVVMRPTLLVSAFVFAVMVMKPLGYLVGSGFLVMQSGVLAGDQWGSELGLVATPVMIFIGSVAMVILTHKVFSIISHLPDRAIPNWLGGSPMSAGQDQDESRIQQGFGMIYQRSESATKEAGQAAAGGGQGPSQMDRIESMLKNQQGGGG
ncbi:MAG: hypothetical protein ABEJ96_01890, partial [Thiohalorhabdaceae bacterium]